MADYVWELYLIVAESLPLHQQPAVQMKPWFRRIVPAPVFAATATISACAHGRNYTDLAGPRFARSAAITDTTVLVGNGAQQSLHVVTFNLEFGRRIGEALKLFRETSELRGADVIVLQEMHEAAVEQLADSLGMGYVYYPATRHPKSGLNFGNAILSRWPVEDDRKLVLPLHGRFRGTQRVAVSGTIRVAGTHVRVYAVHLATLFDNGGNGQREQARAIIADAARYERVVIAGDMNGTEAGREFQRAGFNWTTRKVGATMLFWSVDHVFLRGMTLAAQQSVGVVRDNRGASDHRPVWAMIGIEDINLASLSQTVADTGAILVPYP